jgi:hypothetical protein
MGTYIGKNIMPPPSHPPNLLSHHGSSIQLISDTHIMNYILNPKEIGHPLQVRNTCIALTCTIKYDTGVNVVLLVDKLARRQTPLSTSVIPVSYHSTNAQYSRIKCPYHSPPSSVEVSVGSVLPLPLYNFMACAKTNLPLSTMASKTGLSVVAVSKDTVSSHSKNKENYKKQGMIYRTIMLISNVRREKR